MTSARFARFAIAAACSIYNKERRAVSCVLRRGLRGNKPFRSLTGLAVLLSLIMVLPGGYSTAASSESALPSANGQAGTLLSFSPLYDALDLSPLSAQTHTRSDNVALKLYRYWDGSDEDADGKITGGSGEWTETGRNWTGLAADTATVADFTRNDSWQGGGSVAIFSEQGGTVTVTGTQAFDSLRFTVGGYVLQGGELTIAPFSGSSGTIDVGEALSSTIGSGITGSGLVKTGQGELVLTGTNSYSGKTEIRQGRLVAGAAGSLSSSSQYVLEGGALALGSDDQSIGGLSGSEGAVELGSASLSVNQAVDASFEGSLKGEASSRLILLGLGELSLADTEDYQGGYSIEKGAALEIAGRSSIAVNNSLAGEGRLSLKAGASSDAVSFGDKTGRVFAGVLEVRRGELQLDDNAEKTLSNAQLRLNAGSAAVIDQNRSLRSVEFDGGELRFATAGDRDSAVLRVEDLAVSSNGADIVFEPRTNGNGALPDPGRNFYDYAGTAAQTLLIGAGNTVSGLAENVSLYRPDGTRLDNLHEISLEQNEGKAGTAVFGFGAALVTTGDQKGLYYQESLTELEADKGARLELDSDKASSSSPRIEAKLKGEGGFIFTGSKQAEVGNSLSSYTGSTRVKGGDLVFIADNAFGKTSLLQIDEQGKIDLNGHTQTVGRLTGDEGALLSLGAASGNEGRLIVNQSADSAYSGSIQGQGDLQKLGTGRLTLAGANNYSGDTDVRAGSLIVQGKLGGSLVTVRNNASFGVVNDGAVATDVQIAGGGALIVGNGGTIGGDLTMAANSVLAARNSNSALAVDGTVDLDAGVQLRLQGSQWTTGTYALLAPADPSDLDGFSDIHVPGFLEEYRLVNDSGKLLLKYTQRMPENLTDNQKRVFNVLSDLDKSSDMYQALSGVEAEGFGTSLDMLTGEIHSSLRNSLYLVDRSFSRRLSQHISRASLSRRPILIDESTYMDPGEYDRFATSAGNYYGNNYALWSSLGGTYSAIDGKNGVAKSTMQGPEVAIGVDAMLSNGTLVGAALQYSYKDLEIDDRNSDADIHSYSIALYGGRELDVAGNVLRLILGGQYSYHDLKTTREVRVASVRENLEGEYNANSLRLYAEGAYSMVFAEKFFAEPFLNVGWNWLRTDTFSESGGQATLMGGSKPSDSFSSLLGLRLSLPLHDMMSLNASVGWEHIYGTLDPSLTMGFSRGGDSFRIKGNKMSRDAFAFGIGAGLELTDNFSVNVNYDGSLGKDSETHSGVATLIYSW